eukprot:scaffold186917_cov30-Tisochrysis_lutea.AAC.2
MAAQRTVPGQQCFLFGVCKTLIYVTPQCAYFRKLGFMSSAQAFPARREAAGYFYFPYGRAGSTVYSAWQHSAKYMGSTVHCAWQSKVSEAALASAAAIHESCSQRQYSFPLSCCSAPSGSYTRFPQLCQRGKPFTKRATPPMRGRTSCGAWLSLRCTTESSLHVEPMPWPWHLTRSRSAVACAGVV